MANQVNLVALMSLMLVGCASKKAEPNPEPAPKVEELSKLGDKIDISEQRAAAAVTVVVEHADKPEVVKAEGKVALAYLPKPTDADVAFARERASKQDQKAYNSQIDYAKKLQADVDKAWAKAEQDAKKSQADIQALKDRNVELLKEIERVKKDKSDMAWTFVGAGLCVVGALVTAFMSPKTGISLLLCGAFCGAVPFVVDSPYFIYLSIGTAGVAAALALWYLFDKVRDAVNSNGDSKQP